MSFHQNIVEHEQLGQARAEYGKTVLKRLSGKLQKKYGGGFSVQTLEKVRKFYILYQLPEKENSSTASGILNLPILKQGLSWSHYVELMSVKRDEAREFYALKSRIIHKKIIGQAHHHE